MNDTPTYPRRNQARLWSMQRTGPDGFTLIELLVVISILALLVGLSFPFLRQMVTSTSEQMAAGSLSNAVSAARAYSTRFKPFLDVEESTLRTSADDGDGYSGAAVIVTPANELRIVENDEVATDNLGNRLELPPNNTVPIRNGYRHIDELDDLRLPGRVAALGIQRIASDQIQLLPPPFAISFNRRGSMVVRDNTAGLTATQLANLSRQRRSDGFVYYDADGDGEYDVTVDRDSPRGPGGTPFVPGVTGLTDFARGVAPVIDDEGPMNGRLEMPWERYEPVIGVVIFVPDNVPADVLADNANPDNTLDNLPYDPDRIDPYIIDTDLNNDGITDPDSNNLLQWASEPGQGVVVFFNRHTGADLNR